jgi:hypothetical protein
MKTPRPEAHVAAGRLLSGEVLGCLMRVAGEAGARRVLPVGPGIDAGLSVDVGTAGDRDRFAPWSPRCRKRPRVGLKVYQ